MKAVEAERLIGLLARAIADDAMPATDEQAEEGYDQDKPETRGTGLLSTRTAARPRL